MGWSWDREASLKAYTNAIIRAQEEERQRIARELHDQTIQALAVHCRNLDNIGISAEAPTRSLLQGLQKVRRDIEEIAGQLRELATGLRPPALDNLGIAVPIRRLLEDIEDRSPIKPRLVINGDPRRLPPDVELGIFRIAQEAFTNAERHAQANKLEVTLAFDENRIMLDIADDGIGITGLSQTADFISDQHLGIIGMYERAELLGGKLQLESDSDNGTRVTLIVDITK